MSMLGPARPPRITLGPSFAVALAVLAIVGRASGQGRNSPRVYPDKSTTAETLLRNADNHAGNGQYAEAIEIYQRVIKDFGDKVVLVPPDPGPGAAANADAAVAPEDSSLFVDARLDCQRRIAALPPEGRALYRARVDAQAERWFKQGQAARDRGQLRRVVEQAFCSSWGDDALDLIGDLAFQDGQFAEALSAYRQLVPDTRSGGRGLVHPDPSVDLPRVAAKKLLCRAAVGEDPPTKAELEAFAKEYPNAESSLAGRTGSLATIIAEALGTDHLAVPAQPDGRWPTFAGSPTRSKVAPGAVDVGSLQWRIDLSPIPTPGQPRYSPRRGMSYIGSSPANVPPERMLAYFPIVVGEQVIVADDRFVTAYNLNQRPADGGLTAPALAWQHKLNEGLVTEAARTTYSLARYTLTAFGDRIYARLGPPPSGSFANMGGMGRFGGMGPSPSPSHVVALDRAADGKAIWKKDASEIPLPKGKAGASRTAAFEGTPVADARGVYVVLTERSEMTSTYVACLDADTGSPRWVRYICEANPMNNFLGTLSPEINHRLLTLDGPAIYYQTNLGAVVALDAESGGIRWLATYPWQGRGGTGDTQDRDLNPAIVHDGLVIVAPDDTPSIYAYDAATGRMAWKSRPVPSEVRLAHLLGVAKGHLVATGDRVLLYDVKTGVQAAAWPDGSQSPQGFGRGILAGDKIYWPTKSEIHVLDLETGARAEAPIKLSAFQAGGGNLAVGDGFLVVAGAESMVVFCQNRRLMERYREEIARAPERAVNYYRLAQAAEASGLDDEALENFALVLERAKPSETIDGLVLAESARDHRHRLLMKQGDAARKAKDLARATERFARAAEAARSDRDRLASRLELAGVELDAGRPPSAVATLQSLLADERLRPLVVPAGDGLRSVRADLLIADRLAAIVREHGRGAYAEFDRAAKAMLDRGLKGRDARLLSDIGRRYPAAEVLPEAMLALGRLEEAEGRPREAARAYKRLLVAEVPDDALARAAWGLARAFEAQRLWEPARAAYLRASSRFGGQSIEADGGTARLADLVAARLARGPFDRMPQESAEPALGLPLERRWNAQWPATARPIAAEGAPPSAEQGRIFLAEGTALRAIDPRTGAAAWSANLGSDPVWVGYLADRLVAASRTKVVALDRAKGAVEWQYDPAAPASKGPAGLFANKGDAPEPAAEPATTALQDFRIVGGRVVCLRGDFAIVALDGETGQVDWTFTPAVGRINPRMLVGPERIVLQVRKPNAVLVLDADTGLRRAEFAQTDDDEEWARDPLPIDDDHIVLVPDRRTVSLFDLRRGVSAWTFRESTELPKHGPPRPVGDAERLLVIQDGTDLIRLEPTTGKKRWSRPIGADNLSERPDAFAFSGDRFFAATGSDLLAVSVADGTTAWRQKLIGPSAGWSVALTDRCVVAYPNPARLAGDDEISALPIVFRRRDTGGLVQRLVFPIPASDPTVRLVPRGAFVATQTGLWALNDRRAAERP